MPSISHSFFILGLVVASVTANKTSTDTGSTAAPNELGNYTTSATSLYNTTTTGTLNITLTSTTSNITEGYSTISPSTTKQKGGDNSTNGNETRSTMSSITSPKPVTPSKTTTSTIKSSTASKSDVPSDKTGIIILVVIILIAIGFGLACYFARKRGRRYSVDFTSRADEANIPLSTMDPELPGDAVPQNGLKTFESTETTTKEPQEPEAKSEVQEEQKAEADKSADDPSTESAAPAPSPDSSKDKPKEDVVAEPSPPALVELSVEEKTDDEGIISNKTSVESLKEANENNSNSADFSQKRDPNRSNVLWDVPLDFPV